MKPSLTPSYRAGCGPLFQPGMLPIRVEATTTRKGDLVLSWMHPNDPSGERYFVGVQPQVWVRAADGDLTKPEISWKPVDVPDLCEEVSYTVPDIRRGVTYSIWVEAQAKTPEFPESTRIPVARLTGVTLG